MLILQYDFAHIERNFKTAREGGGRAREGGSRREGQSSDGMGWGERGGRELERGAGSLLLISALQGSSAHQRGGHLADVSVDLRG